MSNNIKVAVRLRPIDEGKKEKWAAGFETHGRRLVLGAKTYDPDVCFGTSSTQDDVFAQAIPILDAVKDGSNGTVLVYGQTGTGKTHTMIGDNSSSYNGVSGKALEYLLQYVNTVRETEPERQMGLTMSVLEIYNEKITDMLSTEKEKPEVTLLAGWPRSRTSVPINDSASAKTALAAALHGRHVSQTAMNERSSRSHVIVLLDLHEVIGETSQVAHLFLVDLAGSESIKKSAATGQAAKEAGMINKSLLALKNVILTLSTASNSASTGAEAAAPSAAPASGKSTHVPYRDSKLTILLQDSIGGTARTLFIACVSPNGRDLDETRSTLDYASKARSIRNVAQTDRDRYQIKIRGLEADVQKLKNRLQDRIVERGGVWLNKEDFEETQAKAERLGGMDEQLKQLLEDRKAAETKQEVAKSTLAYLEHTAKEKDAELQQVKEAFVKAAKDQEAVNAAMHEQLRAVWGKAEGQVSTEWATAHGKLRDAANAATVPAGDADAPVLAEAPVAAVAARFEELLAAQSALVKKSIELGAEMATDIAGEFTAYRRTIEEQAAQNVAAAQQLAASLTKNTAAYEERVQERTTLFHSIARDVTAQSERPQHVRGAVAAQFANFGDAVRDEVTAVMQPTLPEPVQAALRAHEHFGAAGKPLATAALAAVQGLGLNAGEELATYSPTVPSTESGGPSGEGKQASRAGSVASRSASQPPVLGAKVANTEGAAKKRARPTGEGAPSTPTVEAAGEARKLRGTKKASFT